MSIKLTNLQQKELAEAKVDPFDLRIDFYHRASNEACWETAPVLNDAACLSTAFTKASV